MIFLSMNSETIVHDSLFSFLFCNSNLLPYMGWFPSNPALFHFSLLLCVCLIECSSSHHFRFQNDSCSETRVHILSLCILVVVLSALFPSIKRGLFILFNKKYSESRLWISLFHRCLPEIANDSLMICKSPGHFFWLNLSKIWAWKEWNGRPGSRANTNILPLASAT